MKQQAHNTTTALKTAPGVNGERAAQRRAAENDILRADATLLVGEQLKHRVRRLRAKPSTIGV